MTELKATPSFEEFQVLVQQNQGRHEQKSLLIPVFKELVADLETPVSAYLKLSQHSRYSYLLESVEGGEHLARFSFIGTDPHQILIQNESDPLVSIEQHMREWHEVKVAGLPSFTGGAVGYIGYDCVRFFEPSVPVPAKDALGVPDSVFMMSDATVIFDHCKHTVLVVCQARIPLNTAESELSAAYQAALNQIDKLVNRLSAALPPLPSSLTACRGSSLSPEVKLEDNKTEEKQSPQSNVGQAGYEAFVESLKENIRNGDIIQAVPSQRISRATSVHPFEIYRQLRVVNPSPYMFYLQLDTFQVVGASPELLVKVDLDGRVHTRPIAGTRKRGTTAEQDEQLAQELLANEKERAEHIMLVDLGRNDLGRVCEAGSVNVDSLMKIEKYSHVMHIVSHVSGRLAADKTPYDAFRSVFPAGTVSGAPKVRAMQLVSGLEPHKRNIYAGSVGYVSYSGLLDTCIAIRTMVYKDGVAHLQAGGGIVFDSEPTAEYEESMNKMLAVARAIDRAEQVAEARRKTTISGIGQVDALPATFGPFGGRFVPETLVDALEQLEVTFLQALNDPSFHQQLAELHRHYIGRPTPLYLCERLSEMAGGARIWLKREDLCHTGAHKINNAIAQALLAKRTGKRRVIAETGAGQHGVATATACALLDLDCTVYMGEEDCKRQSLNVFRMRLLGAKVVPVMSGTKTLKDAVNEAMRDWVTNVRDTFYIIGSVIGPHPFPTIVREFQSVIGREARAQMLERIGKLPDYVVACVGGGSNAMGTFHPFVQDPSVKLVGVEAAGHGVASGQHAASISGGSIGVLHGFRTYLLQDGDGQVIGTHSISAGLDYPGVGPEHAFYAFSGRASYVAVSDDEALQGMKDLTRCEGIIPALETAHAVYYTVQLAKTLPADQDVLLTLSGRGDKDMVQVSQLLKFDLTHTQS